MKTIARVAILAAVLLVPVLARAYDWNGQTGMAELERTLHGGTFTIQSGHPLATAMAFARAGEWATAAPNASADERARAEVLRQALLTTFRFDVAAYRRSAALASADVLDDLHDIDGYQLVLLGSWLNEMQTNSDMGSNADAAFHEKIVGQFLGWRYRKYLGYLTRDLPDGGSVVRSFRWQADTAYSSSNYLHSMLAVSTDPNMPVTQDQGFNDTLKYTWHSLFAATVNLVIAEKARREAESLRSADDGIIFSNLHELEQMALEVYDRDADENWGEGLGQIGSVFHIMEDSFSTCSPAAYTELRARGQSCVEGDGHTIVRVGLDGLTHVVAMGDDSYYTRKVCGAAPHGLIDDLYRIDFIDSIYGEDEPAQLTGQILTGIALAVRDIVPELREPLYYVDEIGLPTLLGADGKPRVNDASSAEIFAAVQGRLGDVWARAVEARFNMTPREPLPPVPPAEICDGESPDDGLGADYTVDSAGTCALGPVRRPPGSNLLGLAALVLGALLLLRRRA